MSGFSNIGSDISLSGVTVGIEGSNGVPLQQDPSNRLITVDALVSGAIDDSKNVISGALSQIFTELNSGDVDIRSLTFATDSITAHQGGSWDVLQSGTWSVTASGDVGTLKQSSSGELIITGSTIVVRGNDGATDRTLFTDSTGRLYVSGSTVVARGNDGTTDRNLLTDTLGKLQVSIASGSAGIVSVLTGSQIADTNDRALVVHISPNQQPIPTTVVPATAVPGSSVGRASGLSANTFVPVRQTTYVEQTTQAQRSIVSTNANDSSTGTGARTVTIYYYDATCAGPFTETITLNGTTPVNTTNTNICFIESMIVSTVGSNGSNVGTLNLYTGTGATGTIFAAIGTAAVATGTGDNQTFYAHHYVPSGKVIKGYIIVTGIIAAAGGGSSVTVVRYRDPTSSTSPWIVISDFLNASQGNSLSRQYSVSIDLPGPAVVAAFVTPANNNSTATCSFDWSEQ